MEIVGWNPIYFQNHGKDPHFNWKLIFQLPIWQGPMDNMGDGSMYNLSTIMEMISGKSG